MAPVAVLGGDQSASTAAAAGNGVAIADADAPAASTFSAMQIDGDEDIRIQSTAGGVTVDKVFAPGAFTGQSNILAGHVRAQNSDFARVIPAFNWKSGDSMLALFRPQEGDYPLSMNPNTGELSDHVMFARWQIDGRTGFAILGDATGASALPTSGTAQFRGEAVGRTWGTPYQVDVTGRAGMDIDFATSTVRGGIEDFGGYSLNKRLDFNFTAALAGGKFETTALDAPFLTGETGALYGQFYGAASDLEVGGSFNMTFSGGAVSGVFLAGRPISQISFGGAAPVTLRPSFGTLFSGPGGSSAEYNRNNLDYGAGNFESVTYTAGGFLTGDETFAFNTTSGGLPVGLTFGLADYLGRSTRLFYNSMGENGFREIQADVWRRGSATLNRFPLAKVVGGETQRLALAQALEYEVLDFSPGADMRLYAAIGPRIPTSAMPTSGFARFQGEAIGAITDDVANLRLRTIGRATVDIAFATGAVRGAIYNYNSVKLDGSGGMPSPPSFEVEFASTLDASRTFQATVTGARGYFGGVQTNTLAGTVHGELYGTAADGLSELGGVYALEDPGRGSVSGVFVGGRNTFAPAFGYFGPQTFSPAPGAALFLSTVQPVSSLSLSWDRGLSAPEDDKAALTLTRGADTHVVAFPPNSGGFQPTRNVNDASSGLTFLNMTGKDDARVEQSYLTVIEKVSGLDLNYASVAAWTPSGAADPVFLAMGVRTTDMPTSGAAEYKGAVIGRYSYGQVVGNVAMSANFGAGHVAGSANGFAYRSGGAALPQLDLAFTASISGSQFAGAFATNDNAYSGPLAGVFAGPGAAEAAATFRSTTAPPGSHFDGGFVARKQ